MRHCSSGQSAFPGVMSYDVIWCNRIDDHHITFGCSGNGMVYKQARSKIYAHTYTHLHTNARTHTHTAQLTLEK